MGSPFDYDAIQSDMSFRYPYLYHQSHANTGVVSTAYSTSNVEASSFHVGSSQEGNYFGPTNYDELTGR